MCQGINYYQTRHISENYTLLAATVLQVAELRS